jgi:hypothetical protein
MQTVGINLGGIVLDRYGHIRHIHTAAWENWQSIGSSSLVYIYSWDKFRWIRSAGSDIEIWWHTDSMVTWASFPDSRGRQYATNISVWRATCIRVVLLTSVDPGRHKVGKGRIPCGCPLEPPAVENKWPVMVLSKSRPHFKTHKCHGKNKSV